MLFRSGPGCGGIVSAERPASACLDDRAGAPPAPAFKTALSREDSLLIRYKTGPDGKPVKKAVVYTQAEHGIDARSLDRDAVRIVEKLRQAGHDAYVVGGAVLLEASLSFLGLGVPPPTASWGRALADARESLTSAWWCVVPPAAALFFLVLSARKAGEALSESR